MKWIRYDEMFGPTTPDTRRAAREARARGLPKPPVDPWKGFSDYDGYATTTNMPSTSIDSLRKDAIQKLVKYRKYLSRVQMSDLMKQLDRDYPSSSNAEAEFASILATAKALAWSFKHGEVQRQETLNTLTQPDMRGFFPAYEAKDKHSFRSEVGFDTETDDYSKILEISGLKLIWNETKRRYEQIPNATASNSQFYRIYNPQGGIFTRTEQIHGYNADKLNQIHSTLGAAYSSNWDKSQLSEFMAFSKDSLLGGQNIEQADLSWIHQHKSGGFMFMEPSFTQSYVDFIHLLRAIRGKGNNKLQDVAKEFGTSASQLGLPAHEGWADTVVYFKTKEAFINKYYNHPAVQEFLAAANTNATIHSKPYSAPDPIYHSGFVTQRLTKFEDYIPQPIKNFVHGVKVKVADIVKKDIPNALGISEQSWAEDNWSTEKLASEYGEMAMSDDSTELKEYLEKIGKSLGSGGGGDMSAFFKTLEGQEFLKNQAALAHSTHASNRMKVLSLITNKGMSDDEKLSILQSVGYQGTSEDLGRLVYTSKQLEHRKFIEQQKADRARFERTMGNKADLFMKKASRAGFSKADWFEDLQTARKDGEVTQDLLDYAKDRMTKDIEAAKRHEKELALQKQMKEEEQQRRSEAVRMHAEAEGRRFEAHKYAEKQGLAGVDAIKLQDAAAKSSEAYAEALAQINAQTQKATEKQLGFGDTLKKSIDVVGQFNKGLNLPAIESTSRLQHSRIVGAAQGIVPHTFMRFGAAAWNIVNQGIDNVNYTTEKWSQYGRLAQSLIGGGFGGMGGGMGGSMGGGAWGKAGAIAQFAGARLGLEARHNITQYGEGIQHRLNLIGMTIDLFRGLAAAANRLLGAFNKLSRLWDYMPSYTMSTLTGVQWNRASALAQSDRLLGFQPGTQANMYTKLAYQQGDLYTSGRYNEASLVAAARLGIFDLAYAAPGGDPEEQQRQIINRMYASVYDPSISKAERQQRLTLLKDYDPNMPAILERMHGLGFTDYNQITSKRGHHFLRDGENAKVSKTAWDWGLQSTSYREGFALAGSRVYDLAAPIMKAVEAALWAFARGGKLNLTKVGEAIKQFFEDIFGKVDLNSIDWRKKLEVLDPIFEALEDKLVPIASRMLYSFIGAISDTKLNIKWRRLASNFLGLTDYSMDDIVSIHTVKNTETAARETIWGVAAKDYSSYNTAYIGKADDPRLFGDLGEKASKEEERAWDSFRDSVLDAPFIPPRIKKQMLSQTYYGMDSAATDLREHKIARNKRSMFAAVNSLVEDVYNNTPTYYKDKVLPYLTNLLNEYMDDEVEQTVMKTYLDATKGVLQAGATGMNAGSGGGNIILKTVIEGRLRDDVNVKQKLEKEQ